MLQQLGRLAVPGDAVHVDGWLITVEQLDGRRIDQVTLRHQQLGVDDNLDGEDVE